MFNDVRTRPRRWMKAFGPQLIEDPDIVVVSIRDPGAPAILPDGPRVLNLVFEDMTPAEEGSENHDLFDVEKSRAIVEFLYPFATSEHEYTLIAQCNAGISRSGAVAVFAQRLCRIPWEDFVKANPMISPNPYVLQLLMREYYSLG